MIRRRPLVSAEMTAWIAASLDRAEARGLPGARLQRPTLPDVPASRDADPGAAPRAVAGDVAHHLRIGTPFALAPAPSLAPERRDPHALSTIAGSDHHHDERPLVTQDPDPLARPVGFASVMAREPMPLRLTPHVHDPPGGAAAHEIAADMQRIAAGFGVFQHEAAARDGWAGHLSRPTRAAALARFPKRRELPPEDAPTHLSPRPAPATRALGLTSPPPRHGPEEQRAAAGEV